MACLPEPLIYRSEKKLLAETPAKTRAHALIKLFHVYGGNHTFFVIQVTPIVYFI